MPGQQALHTLLNLGVDKNAPVVSIYAEQLSPRLHYACEFIFNHVLKINFLITTQLHEWNDAPHYKISYTQHKRENALHIAPQGLLSETGISPLKPAAFFSGTDIYFFKTDTPADLPFDVFSAVFYFISRYEEWQPFTPDMHGRFEAAASCLHAHNAHLTPVVDQWVAALKTALLRLYPELPFPAATFKAISTIDVDNLFAYRHKGLWRTAGACVKDVLKLDLKNLAARLRVVAGLQKDPFDVYDDLAAFGNELQLPLVFFFLFKTGTTYDRTVNPASPAFGKIIAALKSKGVFTGLHPSYNSAYDTALMEEEVRSFSKTSGEQVTLSRQHFLRFNIASTPHVLMQQGIQADFTMGFASSPGFRAGTSQPFFYYDLAAEKKQELLFVPFCAMDGAYFVYDAVDPEKAFESLWSLAQEIKKVNGLFITVFHERTFSNHLYSGFGPLYKKLYLKLKGL